MEITERTLKEHRSLFDEKLNKMVFFYVIITKVTMKGMRRYMRIYCPIVYDSKNTEGISIWTCPLHRKIARLCGYGYNDDLGLMRNGTGMDMAEDTIRNYLRTLYPENIPFKTSIIFL